MRTCARPISASKVRVIANLKVFVEAFGPLMKLKRDGGITPTSYSIRFFSFLILLSKLARRRQAAFLYRTLRNLVAPITSGPLGLYQR